MLKREIHDIIQASRENGWVIEPEAKRLLSLAGMDIPRFKWAKDMDEAEAFASEIGYPIVAKVVSSKIIHKSDAGGVIVGIDSDDSLREAYSRFSALEGFSGILIEEIITGLELIAGAKIDFQFGPVILLGIGGTAVEIYHDTALKMAPLSESDISSMISGLKAHRLLEGYRGSSPVNLGELSRLMEAFSDLVMDLEDDIDSIDLNPLICSSDRCIAADARIMLKQRSSIN